MSILYCVYNHQRSKSGNWQYCLLITSFLIMVHSKTFLKGILFALRGVSYHVKYMICFRPVHNKDQTIVWGWGWIGLPEVLHSLKKGICLFRKWADTGSTFICSCLYLWTLTLFNICQSSFIQIVSIVLINHSSWYH